MSTHFFRYIWDGEAGPLRQQWEQKKINLDIVLAFKSLTILCKGEKTIEMTILKEAEYSACQDKSVGHNVGSKQAAVQQLHRDREKLI